MNKITQSIRCFFKVKLNYLFFREYRFRRDARRHYLPYYSPTAARARNEKPLVVCMFDGRSYHGGLVDRLRGIMTIYKFCKDNGLDFRIHFVDPFSLERFLLPNKYDWRICGQDISYNTKDSLPIHIDAGSIDKAKEFAFERRITRKFILNGVKKHKQIHVYTNIYYEEKNFNELFRELFKLADRLQKAVGEQLERLDDSNFIAVSTRFCELLGDFNEPRGKHKGVSESKQKLLIERCLAKIDEIKSLNQDTDKVLVTSDSDKFVNTARSKFDYVYSIPGKIAHVDKVDGQAEPDDTHLKTFTDFLTLSHAKKVYLLATGGMYRNSGFSQRAAEIGGHDFERVVF